MNSVDIQELNNQIKEDEFKYFVWVGMTRSGTLKIGRLYEDMHTVELAGVLSCAHAFIVNSDYKE
jgi:hypothetical protein